ncbi:hypothetical protein Scep_020779 [Stephania cephalantha]|uniref:Calmodulin-lysine N-methyltransferase n=1 Tax=Stephania cephalantha TaxID=152367 RepID=A0AAP0NPM8_9MAGN
MEEKYNNIKSLSSSSSSSQIRWGILRDALLHRRRTPSSQPADDHDDDDDSLRFCVKRISRKTFHGFNLIPCRLLDGNQYSNCSSKPKPKHDVFVSYTLPSPSLGDPTTPSTLLLRQRVENHIDFDDFDVSHNFHIDNTGLVCHWPSEDVLAHFCLSRADMFRSKRILELGAGYGFAGLAIAAGTEALEVVISDGNPKVVDYIQHNIHANSEAFADTKVKSLILHWNEELDSNTSNNTFDIIVASDCTFFKEFHGGLANIIKSLLKPSAASQAIFFSPRRGDSLDKFLEKVKEAGLHFTIADNYDEVVWERHQKFLLGDSSLNYEQDHCYPLMMLCGTFFGEVMVTANYVIVASAMVLHGIAMGGNMYIGSPSVRNKK